MTQTAPRRAHPRRPAESGRPLATAAIRVSEPAHLWSVQTMTRALCRALGLEEPDVYRALISVTELAERRCAAGGGGEVAISVVRRGPGLGLEVRAGGADGPPDLSLDLPLPESSPYAGPREEP